MKIRPSLLALSLCALAVTAQANAEGDPERGELLAYTCHGCHGIPNYKNAYPTYSVPKLGGQHAAYMVAALKAYASQERPHPTMYSHAATMSEQDMVDVAAYLEGKPIESGGDVVGTPPAATATCVACHGNEGVGILPEYPTLAGQHADYLAHALREYRSGRRKNAIMAGFAAGLSDADIEAIALFFSQQRPGLCSSLDVRKYGECQQ
ncbi:MAG TPA: c-type cytochrome [Steroidobacteraceae bacterium]|nr:c-type cytochrome [Steroidobacteraceae bacterium]